MIPNESPMPGMSSQPNPAIDYNVKYMKIDLDDPGDKMDLQDIETRALRDAGVQILTRDKFTFMDRYFMIISYMERNAA